MDWVWEIKRMTPRKLLPVAYAQVVDGWWCPTLRWEPLGMTGSGQSREVWKITRHSTFLLFSAIAPCTVPARSLAVACCHLPPVPQTPTRQHGRFSTELLFLGRKGGYASHFSASKTVLPLLCLVNTYLSFGS